MVKTVIFDWAGTTVDYGCMAPVKGFVDGFASIGYHITDSTARAPMGLAKLDHVRAIAKVLDADISEDNIQSVYRVFESKLMETIEIYCDLNDYVIETMAALRSRGIKIGSTTGYTAPMMKKVLPVAKEKGYSPDFCITPEEAGKGRPYPYMIWRNLMEFGISAPREAVKVGDTAADIAEGKKADCWTVGIIMGSSELGLTRDEVSALSEKELDDNRKRVIKAFYKAGADYIINDLSELLPIIDDIDRKLKQNSEHILLTPGPLSTKYSVKNAMLTDHCTWDDEYKSITKSVLNDITAISANSDYATVLFQGSGSYSVEAMINCLCPVDEKTLFLVNGAYGRRMLTIARNSKKEFGDLTFDDTQPIDVTLLENKLINDDKIKTVVFVHCETTTGVINPLEKIVKVAKKYNKRVLVDTMSSFAAYEIDMPGLDIDAIASSANKCLEGLPGLSFVIAKKKLIEESKDRSLSHSLDLYDQYLGLYKDGGKFRFTSPTNILLALRQAIDEYKKEGGQKARFARYKENHDIIVKGLSLLGFKPIIAAEFQSDIITTFDLGTVDFSRMYAYLKSKGYIIYPGKLTSLPTFRVGNIGNIYPSDMKALTDVIREYLLFFA